MLSKSRVLDCQQCPRKLWLTINKPELLAEDAANRSIQFGRQVGDIAKRLYDPKGVGHSVERYPIDAALVRTQALLASGKPIFEAGFSARGVAVFADVLLERRRRRNPGWGIIEVKSSTSIKDHFLDDLALQVEVIRSSGLALTSAAIACIDSAWVYPGNEDYRGLLVETDATDEVANRSRAIRKAVRSAKTIFGQATEPLIRVGDHCEDPVGCGFLDYCSDKEPRATYPVDWLPRIQSKPLRSLIQGLEVRDMRHVPDELLSERQRLVKSHTLSGKTYFNVKQTISALSACQTPLRFLDLETIQFAIPIWKGTRPYQQIPFQFSLHKISRTGEVSHEEFLDLSGNDPSRQLAEQLIRSCGERGSIFVYNAAFEMTRIKELGDRFPALRRALLAINSRIVDLRPIAEENYYHPDQCGSWSIKRLLPSLVPSLDYESLDGVNNGTMAMEAFFEAISAIVSRDRKEELRRQLLAYCKHDTYAMVRIWQVFAGKSDLQL